MEKRIILRGILAGAVGGLLAFVFARIFAEPVIGRAIDYESGRDDAQHALDQAAGIAADGHSHEVFTRSIQENVGIGVGMILFGIAMGALFAVIYTLCVGRVGRIVPANLALLVAGGMFLAFYLVPFIKYPANPPAVGHEGSIGQRTELYLAMVVSAAVVLLGAVLLGRALHARLGNRNATLVAAAAFVVVMGAVMLALPSLGQLHVNRTEYGDFATETPQPLRDPSGHIVYPGFSADDLYLFRLYAVAAQALLWSTIGLVFGPLVARLLPAAARSEPPADRAVPQVV